MALLRAIGASRRQVMGSVIIEAAIVGALFSALGLVAGIGLAGLLKAALGAIGLGIPSTGTVVTPGSMITAFLIGLVVTLVVAIAPARRAAKVPPVAAMRDVDCRLERHVEDADRRRIARARRRGRPALPRPVRRRQRRLGQRGRGCRAHVPGRRGARPDLGPPAQRGHRCTGVPTGRGDGPPGPAERVAQPQAHVGHGRRPHDRRRPGRLLHHLRGVGHGLAQPHHRRPVPRRLPRRLGTELRRRTAAHRRDPDLSGPRRQDGARRANGQRQDLRQRHRHRRRGHRRPSPRSPIWTSPRDRSTGWAPTRSP